MATEPEVEWIKENVSALVFYKGLIWRIFLDDNKVWALKRHNRKNAPIYRFHKSGLKGCLSYIKEVLAQSDPQR